MQQTFPDDGIFGLLFSDKRYSSTVTTQGKRKPGSQPCSRRKVLLLSAVQKSRRVEHAAELWADLTLRHLLKAQRSREIPSPAWCPWDWAFRGSPSGHTHTPQVSKSVTTPPFSFSHGQLNNRKQTVPWIVSTLSVQTQSLPFLPGIHRGDHDRRHWITLSNTA